MKDKKTILIKGEGTNHFMYEINGLITEPLTFVSDSMLIAVGDKITNNEKWFEIINREGTQTYSLKEYKF